MRAFDILYTPLDPGIELIVDIIQYILTKS